MDNSVKMLAYYYFYKLTNINGNMLNDYLLENKLLFINRRKKVNPGHSKYTYNFNLLYYHTYTLEY